MVLFKKRMDLYTQTGVPGVNFSGTEFFNRIVFAHEFGHLLGDGPHRSRPNIMAPNLIPIVDGENIRQILLNNGKLWDMYRILPVLNGLQTWFPVR